MTIRLEITVEIDAAAVENALAHADVAVDACVMTRDESCRWVRAELDRFVVASA